MRNKLLLIFIVVLMGICVTMVGNQKASAEAIQTLDDMCELLTQNDTVDDINIQDYAQECAEFSVKTTWANNSKKVRVFDSGIYFQNNCRFSGINSTYVDISIDGDDNIVKFVPRQLFTAECEKYYIGRKYGFYVNTKYVNTKLVSDVVLFAINESDITLDYLLDITVQPIMRMCYEYVDQIEEEYNFVGKNEDEYKHKCTKLRVKSGVKNAVIPLVKSYTEYEQIVGDHKYYFAYKIPSLQITDISFGASLYNCNSLNYGDIGYNIDNDYGYFFTGNQYEFDATKKSGGSWLRGVHQLTNTALSVAIGKVPVAGDVYTAVDATVSVVDSIRIISGGMTYNATNKNYDYTDLNLYNTRAMQKSQYGNLIKASAIEINTSGDDTLYFMTGDYAKGTYHFSHTDKSIGKEHCKLDVYVAMKITENGTTTAHVSAPISYDINQSETYSMNEIGQTDYYLLPNGQMEFAVTPRYFGRYTMDTNCADIEVWVDGAKVPVINGICTLDMDTSTHNVIIKNIGSAHLIGGVDMDCQDLVGTHTLQAGKSYIYKVERQDSIRSVIDTNNDSVKICDVYLQNMALLSGNVNNKDALIEFVNNKMYVVVQNVASSVQTVTVERREAQQLTDGSYIELQQGHNIAEYDFTAGKDGEFFFKLSNDANGAKGYVISIGSYNLSDKAFSVSTGTTCKTYKVALTSGERVSFIIKRNDSAQNAIRLPVVIFDQNLHSWIVNGNTTTRSEATVERGSEIEITLIDVNGNELRLLSDYLYTSNYGTCSVSEDGKLIIDNMAMLCDIDLYFDEMWTSYDENHNVVNLTDKVVFTVRIIADRRLKFALKVFNNQDGFGFTINNNLVNSVKYVISNGFSSPKTFWTTTGSTICNISNLMSYNADYLTVIMRPEQIYYACKGPSAAGITYIALDNFTRGVSFDLSVNHLFSQGGSSANAGIKCRRHLENIAKAGGSRTFSLLNDIDLSGRDWTPINNFISGFNGNGFKISNMKIVIPNNASALSYYGLFGTNKGTVHDLKLVGIDISSGVYIGGNTVSVGGIAGNNEGYVYNVEVSGKIDCNRNMSAAGGIAGYNKGHTIRDCRVHDMYIYGNGNIGGIVGESVGGTITRCSTSNLTAELYVVNANRSLGGIVGKMSSGAVVEYSYNQNTKIKFDDYKGLDPDQINPFMGKIAGSMSASTIRNVSVSGATWIMVICRKNTEIGL